MTLVEQALTYVRTDKASATRNQKIHRGGCYVSELAQVEIRLECNARTIQISVSTQGCYLRKREISLLLVARRGSATDNRRRRGPAGVYAGRSGRDFRWRQTH